jgi:hypothetical protein
VYICPGIGWLPGRRLMVVVTSNSVFPVGDQQGCVL